MPIIHRDFSAEFKEERSEGDGLPILVGHAAVFNQVYETPWFTEDIAPGAFQESITRGDDVAALFNHDVNFPLARRRASNLDLFEDDKGLLTRIRPTNTSFARDLIENVRAGVVSQMSFGFDIEKEELDKSKKKPHFRILKVRLWDVSPVTFPAYEQTDIHVASAEAHFKKRLEQLGLDESNEFVGETLARTLYELRNRELFVLKNRSNGSR